MEYRDKKKMRKQSIGRSGPDRGYIWDRVVAGTLVADSGASVSGKRSDGDFIRSVTGTGPDSKQTEQTALYRLQKGELLILLKWKDRRTKREHGHFVCLLRRPTYQIWPRSCI